MEPKLTTEEAMAICFSLAYFVVVIGFAVSVLSSLWGKKRNDTNYHESN